MNERKRRNKKKKQERDYVLCVLRLSPDKLSFTGLFFCDFMKKKHYIIVVADRFNSPPKKISRKFSVEIVSVVFCLFPTQKILSLFYFLNFILFYGLLLF
jgi:hypothetical protein